MGSPRVVFDHWRSFIVNGFCPVSTFNLRHRHQVCCWLGNDVYLVLASRQFRAIVFFWVAYRRDNFVFCYHYTASYGVFVCYGYSASVACGL